MKTEQSEFYKINTKIMSLLAPDSPSSFIEIIRDPIGGFVKRDLFKNGVFSSWCKYDYPVESYIKLVEMSNYIEKVTKEQVFIELV